MVPEVVAELDTVTRTRTPWIVILYNDDRHAFPDVILWVQKATGCALAKARAITLAAHETGRAVAYTGEKTDCERVCASLRSHGLQVEIDTIGDSA